MSLKNVTQKGHLKCAQIWLVNIYFFTRGYFGHSASIKKKIKPNSLKNWKEKNVGEPTCAHPRCGIYLIHARSYSLFPYTCTRVWLWLCWVCDAVGCVWFDGEQHWQTLTPIQGDSIENTLKIYLSLPHYLTTSLPWLICHYLTIIIDMSLPHYHDWYVTTSLPWLTCHYLTTSLLYVTTICHYHMSLLCNVE